MNTESSGTTAVETADRLSRKRARLVAATTLIFLGIQAAWHPYFVGVHDAGDRALRTGLWALYAFVLCLILATGGAVLLRKSVRSLMNDEVMRKNQQTAVVIGYWVAMATAWALYFVPRFESATAREAIYLIVTLSVGAGLLTFSYLESRAHRDG